MSSTKSDEIRVLVFIKGLGLGGAETLIAHSASLWNREGFSYLVAYMLPWKDHFVGRIEDSGVNVACIDWHRPPGVKAISRLRHLFNEWRPDIVHSHLPAAGIIARLALPAATHVYTEHNITDSYRQPTRTMNRITYGRNSAVIAVSEAVALSVAGFPGPEPHVIHNGVAVSVPHSETTRARTEIGLSDEDPLVVHVGNIRPNKGHDNLVEATNLLLKITPDATVVSIGSEKQDGDLERLRSQTRNKGISERLRFIGQRGDAVSFLAAADVVVNPSDVEGLPVSLLEALALERPVVATSVGGVPSIIDHERTGLLVPPRRPDLLAKAIQQALESPKSADWGKEGARMVRAEFGLQRMVAAYESLYSDLVDA